MYIYNHICMYHMYKPYTCLHTDLNIVPGTHIHCNIPILHTNQSTVSPP